MKIQVIIFKIVVLITYTNSSHVLAPKKTRKLMETSHQQSSLGTTTNVPSSGGRVEDTECN